MNKDIDEQRFKSLSVKMSVSLTKEPLIKRLRRGEKIECPNCGNAYLTTSAKNISISHGFSCDKCGYAINIDPVMDIEQKLQ